MRIGIGYDAHRLTEGRSLILGGVHIPFQQGLDGHSDADVLIHAIMDALLGAAALGDIGTHFPDNDERYRGAASIDLLKEVAHMITEAGYTVLNIDSILIAQAPRLAPYIEKMCLQIAYALAIKPSCISVKATTEEQMGFTGAGEGIAAKAVCLLDNRQKG